MHKSQGLPNRCTCYALGHARTQRSSAHGRQAFCSAASSPLQRFPPLTENASPAHTRNSGQGEDAVMIEKRRGRMRNRRDQQRQRASFQDVLSLLQAGADKGAAFTALEVALGSGETPSNKMVQNLTQGFGSRSLAAGLHCASQLPLQGCQSYVTLLRMCEARSSLKGVQEVIRCMCTDPRISTVRQAQTALICAFQCLARLRKPEMAVEVFEAYTGRGQGNASARVQVADHASVPVFNNFLNSLTSDVNLAYEWFLRLQERGFVPNLISHNTVLKACMRTQQSDKAEAVMESLASLHLQADEYTYLSLIKAFTYSSEIAKAMQVRQQMERADFRPTAKIWGALIIASSRGSLENAFAVWREMRQLWRGQPPIQCLEALMQACVGAYQGERALQLLRAAQAEGSPLSQTCYNIAIKACGSPPGVQLLHTQLDLGYGLLAEMQGAGFTPDRLTHTSLFILCAQAKDGERALQSYLLLKGSGFQMDAMMCTALLSALGKQKTTASKVMLVFEDMVSGPPAMQPTDKTYRTVIGLCCENGLLEEALQVYKVMRSQGCAPSPQQFKMLTQACAEQALEEGAQSTLPAKMLEILGLGDLYELDLHRLSSLEARAVVLCGILNLQQAFRRGEQPAADLVIITGQGKHSDGDEGSTLGPAIAQLLTSELRMEVTNEIGLESGTKGHLVNLGRLVVPRASLAVWLEAKIGAVSK